ncbi:MAG: TSUP family transporter [Rhodospirillales bacterium]|nr:TSUP family transporter [Rhodospirillales bacterium]
MTPEYFSILAVIAVLSVVQSLFGMGVLVFGTPTLLLMGFDFIPTLGYLLPASFAISLLQVLSARHDRVPVSRYLFLLCLPAIGVGLWLAEASPLATWSRTLIGGTLLFSALVRFWAPSRNLLITFLEKQSPAYHFVMGLVHGLTNLGGALLAILASGTHSEKGAIRSSVAQYYLAFSTIQMMFLAFFMGHSDLFISNLLTAVVSASVYLLIGNRIFSYTSSPVYNVALSVFIALYGVVVLIDF